MNPVFGGAWHPDSTRAKNRSASLSQIGVPGILTGMAMRSWARRRFRDADTMSVPGTGPRVFFDTLISARRFSHRTPRGCHP